jgi:transcriptional regulator with PAS, ATPase and Fis domain
MNTLFTWLGSTDINNAKENKDAAIASIAMRSDSPFDKIVILANDWERDWDFYRGWLSTRLAEEHKPSNNVNIIKASIISPIHYESILKVSSHWIDKLSSESDKLTISLTSGTPAMISMAVILGKAKANVEFIQSSEKTGISIPKIPVDFAKEYVKSAAKGIASNAIKPSKSLRLEDIVAQSALMADVIEKSEILAKSELPVLVLGETGTGKEVLSNAIHLASLRHDKTFKAVNCGALPATLVDSILFGHEKGAFTGANNQHKGLFEQATGGTLFLDEVGELSADVQVRLLRVLQEKTVTRVGGIEEIDVDVRLIAATHRNLIKMAAIGEFREDLFYRLAIGVIELPSLRERVADIPHLIEEISTEINNAASTQIGTKSKNISKKAIEFVISQAWPGNIRELQNTLNRAFLWSKASEISSKNILDAMIIRGSQNQDTDIVLSVSDKVDINELIEKYKKNYIVAALKACGNNVTKASKMLSLGSPQALGAWITALGIEINK